MTNTPETFDIEAWLTDAHLPEESADVYKRADVISELSELRRRIELEDAADDPQERTIGQKSPTADLEARYAELLQTFAASKLTVYVRALTGEELRTARAEHEKRTEGMEPKEANIEFGYDLLAAAIVGMKPAGGERKPVSMTSQAVKKLAAGIGEVQVSAILQARQQAQSGVPQVDADFLLQRSGTSDDSRE